ncbi:hypothetical protein OS493_009970 [Desmophyllum pertusum]|uniref:EF-hand domain-containing protein n=1 Tax=Desmophyllum pertusum TaxID=174260 RepID=A0A9X0CFZ5_9CNID|nr:hypothetical protein OS493_009970 [Desmophyllum pertusum]
MDSSCNGVILATFIFSLVACDSTGQIHDQFDDLPGPCMVRRKKLPRLDPVKVGYVRQIELIKEEKPFTVKTLSVKPPIFEIPDFLSEAETKRILDLAERGRLENSDVFHYSMDALLSQTSFEQWDLNRDGVINSDEVQYSAARLSSIIRN